MPPEENLSVVLDTEAPFFNKKMGVFYPKSGVLDEKSSVFPSSYREIMK